MNTVKPKVIDLFAGVGGFSLGLMRAGFDLALAVDNDKHAIAAHKANFPNAKHLAANIGELDGDTILEAACLSRGQLAGLIGGPPCQGFSTIGKQNSDDSRNDLFVKFFELVHECEPKFFVAENVLGILHNKFEATRTRANTLVEGRYKLLPPLKLKASDLGAPTTRERVFFIGWRNDTEVNLSTKDFEARKVIKKTTVEEALYGLPLEIDENWLTEDDSWQVVDPLPNSPYWDRVQGHIPDNVGNHDALQRYKVKRLVSGCFGTRHTPDVLQRYSNMQQGEKDTISKATRLEVHGLCPTIRAGTGSDRGSFQAVRPIHPTQPRVITPREAARLQGFPDWFQFSPTKWHSFRQIGNSVSPLVAEVIFDIIVSRFPR